MDPNKTLERLRELANRDMSDEEQHEFHLLWADLDAWLTHGGFPPRAWDWTKR